MPRSAPAPTLAPAPSPATMTASRRTGRRSAPAPSSARTARWWRRSPSAKAQSSPPAAWSPWTSPPMRWPSPARRRSRSPTGRAASACGSATPRPPARAGDGRNEGRAMCGIIGILGKAPVAPLLLDGLKRLEYRGYDSAGIATLVNGHIDRRRAEGKLINLAALLDRAPLDGTVGIGHTRWATHGRPNETNAHPHATGRVAVVHNGIIENFQELRDELTALGHAFETETDTETVAHLLTRYLDEQKSPEEAMEAAMARLRGAFALAIIFAGRHDLMIGARRGSPLVVGYGDGEMFLGSDALALAPLTRKICYLEEDDWAVVRADGATIHHGGKVVDRPVKQTALSGALIGKG